MRALTLAGRGTRQESDDGGGVVDEEALDGVQVRRRRAREIPAHAAVAAAVEITHVNVKGRARAKKRTINMRVRT